MRRISFCHVSEQIYHLFQKHLEFSGNDLEFRNHENADDQAEHQKDSCDKESGDKPRIHIDQSEQIHFEGLMQNRIPHDNPNILACSGFGKPGYDNAGQKQNECHAENDACFYLMFFTHN